jgi:uncharacterized protein (DUF885 family)
MRRSFAYLGAAALALGGLVAVAAPTQQTPLPPAPDAEKFAHLVDDFLVRMAAEDPVWATGLGLHEHDAELGSYAPAAIARKRRLLSTTLDALAQVDPARLDRQAAIDLRYFVAKLRSWRLDLDEVRAYARQPDVYNSEAAAAIDGLLKRDFAPLCTRAQHAAQRMREIPRLLEEGKKNLDHPARVLVDTAIAQTTGALDFFDQAVPAATSGCADPAIVKDVTEARTRAAAALRDWKQYLTKLRPSAPEGSFALGADLFARRLALDEFVDDPLPVLLSQGRAELGRLRADFEKTAHAIDPNHTPAEVIAAVNAEHPTADDLLPAFRRTATSIRKFLVDKKIVPLPSGEDLRIDETPVWQRALSFASMETPGPFETRATQGYFYVTPVERGWTAEHIEEHLRAYDRFGIENTILHEAYPGHYIQGLYQRTSPRTVRRIFGSGAFIEGWALYCEQMMLEQGQNRDPRAWLAMLQWALLRAGRYLAGTAMHTQGMTPLEAARFLEEQAYMTPANALREAERFAGDPFVLVYQLGKLQIQALAVETRRLEGPRFRLADFHRRLLETAALPVPLGRELVLGHAPATGR